MRLSLCCWIGVTAVSFVATKAWKLDTAPSLQWGGRQSSRNKSSNTFVSSLRGGASDAIFSSAPVPVPCIEEPPVWGTSKEKRALLLMDVFSDYHGMYLAHVAKHVYGVAVVPVFSDYMKGYFQMNQPDNFEQLMSMCMPSPEQKGQWSLPLQGYELVAISCESDSGLADAERLGDLLNVSHNNGVNEARRDKYKMIDALAAAGLPVVKQSLCDTVEEAREFCTNVLGLGSDRAKFVIVKPIRGVASEDVYLCRNIAAVELAFSNIKGSTVFGSPKEKHNAVLIQEFAVGQEFAIDIVSKDGEHKAAAIWIYDKRPANGASFVYFSTKLYSGELASVIYNYSKKSLDALGIRWGLTHIEVIITDEGPRLVEVNCRQHNMDFLPLTMESIGYNAFDMLLAAHLGGKDDSCYPPESEVQRLDWDLLPYYPSTRMDGAMVHLVNYANGSLIGVNETSLIEIQNMDSVIDLEVYGPFLELGNEILPTKDIRSDAGWVQMLNPVQEAFQRDYERIVELMPTLFQVGEVRR